MKNRRGESREAYIYMTIPIKTLWKKTLKQIEEILDIKYSHAKRYFLEQAKLEEWYKKKKRR